MNAPAPTCTAPIESLRARLERLARDPRAKFLHSELPQVVNELRDVLATIEDTARRLVALERACGNAILLTTREDDTHDSP